MPYLPPATSIHRTICSSTKPHCLPKPAGEGGRALNKAYRKEKVLREELYNFKTRLRTLLGRINIDESKENAKNHLRDFLNDTGYKGQHLIATKGRAGLVIHSEKKASSPVSVLFEVKRPRGKNDPKSAEMVSRERMNAKALHELIRKPARVREAPGVAFATPLLVRRAAG